MSVKLFFQALVKFTAGVAFVALPLFISAGTLLFRNAWILICILFIPMFVAGIVMMIRDPEFLKKRLNAVEKEKEQKLVIALSGIMFPAAFIVAGLNFRFKWLTVSDIAVYAAAAVFLAAYLMYAEVMRENAFLSRTVEIQENQKVVDSGLYGVVRHPMYSATLLLFLSMGIVLGSPVSFAILLFYIPIIVIRIRNEEKVLEEGLEGYTEYEKKVRYRLIPFIW